MQFFANKIIQALCWTLVHSLWQGLLLAIVAGVIIMLTKKSAVVSRYNLLAGIMVVFILFSACTFYYEMQAIQQKPVAVTEINSLTIAGNNIPTPTFITGLDHSGFIKKIISFLNANAGFIVAIWILVIALRCIQLVAGFRNMYVLKHKQVEDAGDYWNRRVKELAATLTIKKTVQLLKSGIAKVPMVAGHLKPVILIPAGLLTSLPQDEIEAILLHELAHIHRKDYLVNMLQSFCEILYFFNPAVLWLSALLKEERENCCDDIAISKIKNKKQFIDALVAFQEYNLSAAPYTIAFPGNRDHLLNRVKRILTNNNKTLNTMEKSLLATGLVITGFIALAFSQNNATPATEKVKTAVNKAAVEINRQDTVPVKERIAEKRSTSRINTTKDGKEYRIVIENDKITELYVDGEKIPAEKINDYKQVVDEIIEETKQQSAMARKQAAAAKERAKELRKIATDERRQAEQKRVARESEPTRKAERALKRTEESGALMEESKSLLQERKKMQLESEKLAQQALRQAEEFRQLAAQLRASESHNLAEQKKYQANLKRIQYGQSKFLLNHKRTLFEQSKRKAAQSRIQAEKVKLQSMARIKVERSKQVNSLLDGIIDDLKAEGIVKDDKEISLSLDNGSFRVNGVQQPEAVHMKFKQKYLKGPGDHINHSRTSNSTNTSIHIDNKQ